MHETKLFEIRDRATFIPVLASPTISNNEHEKYLLWRAGFAVDSHFIFVTRLCDGLSTYNPRHWGENRTMFHAHKFIETNFLSLVSGDIIDVEYILGETTIRKISEQYERE